jgi:exportin-T
LRARFIALLHRLVECLMGHILRYLPAALEALMHSQVDAADMVDVLNLLVQLVLRFKEALAGLMEALLPPVAAQVHCLLGADWDWSGQLAGPAPVTQATANSSTVSSTSQGQQQDQRLQVAATLEDVREKGELQRAYYSLLHAIAHNNLTQVLMRSNAQVLDMELTAVTRGAATHVDPTVRKTCLQVSCCIWSVNLQMASAPSGAFLTVVLGQEASA